jgi:hypothetical protein
MSSKKLVRENNCFYGIFQKTYFIFFQKASNFGIINLVAQFHDPVNTIFFFIFETKGANYDHMTDIYSLGKVICFIFDAFKL